MIDLPPEMTTLLIISTGTLLLVLIVSIITRPRVFTQYLDHMAGIKLSPKEVASVYKTRGKAGVRELFIELIIREDIKDGVSLSPDSHMESPVRAAKE